MKDTWIDIVEDLQRKWGTLPSDPQMNSTEIQGTLHQIEEELEEWQEVVDHMKQHGRTQESQDMLSDVIVDLIYYILQSGVRSGLQEDIKKRFYSVYHNNIAKVTDVENAEESVRAYVEAEGVSHSIREAGIKGTFLVIRDHDNKIRKPIGFVEI